MAVLEDDFREGEPAARPLSPEGLHRAPRWRILCAEDDPVTRLLLQRVLARVYDVEAVEDGLAAVQAFERLPADMVVLDIMMPRMSGWEACKHLRTLSDVPIVFLTSLHNVDDIVKGFAIGADDYIAKPFAVEELLARIEAIFRRVTRAARPANEVLQRGPLRLDVTHHQAWIDEREVQLTPIEFGLLHYLASRPGQNVSKEVLFRNVWGYNFFGDTNLVEVGVRRLREKIERDASRPQMILTVRGVGYRFQVPEEKVEA